MRRQLQQQVQRGREQQVLQERQHGTIQWTAVAESPRLQLLSQPTA
jgi:hypothetical protein